MNLLLRYLRRGDDPHRVRLNPVVAPCSYPGSPGTRGSIFVLVLAVFAVRAIALPAIQVRELPPPSHRTAVAPSLAVSPGGTVWLTWIEPDRGSATPRMLRFSEFDSVNQRWRAPRTIAAEAHLVLQATDVPQLASDGHGRLFAVWCDDHDGAMVTESGDNGATWTGSTPWTTDGHEVEKFSLTTLSDGRVLAIWLDGGSRKSGGKTEQLFARLLGQPRTPDQRIDGSVCDCCPTAVIPFLDGGALAAYRGRDETETRDIRTARFRLSQWNEPRPLSADDWHLNACPVNGPRLSTDGSRVGAAWFTGADNDPRVLVSFSPDAGARWLMPLRVDCGHPLGHVDTALLHDGALLVIWTEADGGLWLRRITPDFSVTAPIQLAAAMKRQGLPRLALVRDYSGGNTAATLLVAYPGAGESDGVHTLILSVPEGELVHAERNCECAPTPEQLRGFPIRGKLLSLRTGAARVTHLAVPGVFPAGTQEFKIGPDATSEAQAGRQFLGRIERREGDWWLFDVRLLATSPAAEHR